MNRIGPSKSELYVANADGSGEHKLLSTSGFPSYESRTDPDGTCSSLVGFWSTT
jgi:hypothetical protein